LKNQAIRSHLIKNIHQEKFEEGKHQILTEQSFHDLYFIIFNLFSLTNPDDRDDLCLLTKSCFYYKYLIKGKQYQFIYQSLVKKGNTFPIWGDYDFWLKWFENDLLKPSRMSSDDHYFSLLLTIASTMGSLNIDLKTILFFIVDKIGQSYIKDSSLLKDMTLVIVKQNNNKNYQ
jgi:hypothetical protein